MVCNKISSAIKWLDELINYINKTKSSDLIKSNPYIKWHAVKLISSAAESIITKTSINSKIVDLDENQSDLDKKTS
jgi:hypothetical protein